MNSDFLATKITPLDEFPSICVQGKLIDMRKPLVMGIINVNQDSFYAGSRASQISEILELARKHMDDGADILDVGASSTRPGASISSANDEIEVLIPVLKALRNEFPTATISIDTYHSEVVLALADFGMDIVNDISGGRFDEQMFSTVAKLKLPYILMHIQGTPETMQVNPSYENVVEDVLKDCAFRVKQLYSLGCKDIIVDPGFGFGKTLEQNYSLLKHLARFKQLGTPLLIGLSRKSMINKVLNCKADEALNGTTALNTIALLNGANILRVHDVKEAVEALKIVQQYQLAL